MKKIIVALVLFLTTSIGYAQFAATAEETRLYNLLMEFRNQHGLPTIPLSRSLNYVAQVHARDIVNYPQAAPCIPHSWSQNGKWTACCYTTNPDQAQKNCMWSKPAELTPYKGYGFEILSEAYGGNITADQAFQLWTRETPGVGGHITVILNQAAWTTPFNAIGVAIFNSVASVWFGWNADN